MRHESAPGALGARVLMTFSLYAELSGAVIIQKPESAGLLCRDVVRKLFPASKPSGQRGVRGVHRALPKDSTNPRTLVDRETTVCPPNRNKRALSNVRRIFIYANFGGATPLSPQSVPCDDALVALIKYPSLFRSNQPHRNANECPHKILIVTRFDFFEACRMSSLYERAL
jgi:hypothetical protein